MILEQGLRSREMQRGWSCSRGGGSWGCGRLATYAASTKKTSLIIMHKCCFMLKNYGSSPWPRSKFRKKDTRLPKIVMQVARCCSGSWGRSRGRSRVENFVRTAGQNGTQTWRHIERIWTGITFSKSGSMLKPWRDVSICIASLCQRKLSQAKFSIWNATMRWSGPCGRCSLWSWIFFFAAFCFFFQSYLVVIRSMISDMIYSNI